MSTGEETPGYKVGFATCLLTLPWTDTISETLNLAGLQL